MAIPCIDRGEGCTHGRCSGFSFSSTRGLRPCADRSDGHGNSGDSLRRVRCTRDGCGWRDWVIFHSTESRGSESSNRKIRNNGVGSREDPRTCKKILEGEIPGKYQKLYRNSCKLKHSSPYSSSHIILGHISGIRYDHASIRPMRIQRSSYWIIIRVKIFVV